MQKEKRLCERWDGLAGPLDERFVRTGEAHLVKAKSSSARAAAVVECVENALAQGAQSSQLLVVCADPAGASAMRKRLSKNGSAGDVTVLTAREIACSILESPEAASATGISFTSGKTRILAAYECDFVVEDVKTLGARPGRLREMLKFLYRGWTELSDEDPEWLFTMEEIDTFEFLTRELMYLKAVMEPQVSNLAAKALRLDNALLAKWAKSHVFVMDYQNLSRASQLMCQLLAGEYLMAAADDTACADVYESYPCQEGLSDFMRLNPAAQIVEKEVDSTRIVRNSRTWDTPHDEIEGIADLIAADIASGTSPDDVAVMTFHPWWAQQMERALRSRSLPANRHYSPLKLRGDIRELDRCLALRAITLLRMLADPQDAVAWRSWFGFGDYLTRSNLFAAMRRGAAATNSVRADLESFGYDLGADLDPLFHEVHDLRGPELVSYLVKTLAGPDAPIPPVLSSLFVLGPGADAAHMVAELDRRQFFDGIAPGRGVVVSSYNAMAGLDFEKMYVVGCVNGLFPKADYFDLTKVSVNKQAKMAKNDSAAARAMANMGREGVCVSGFERANSEFAENVGLKQVRIFASEADGSRIAEIAPSIYVNVIACRA